MKTMLSSLLIGLLGTLSLGEFNASANLEISGSVAIHATADFYQPLAAHGAWIEVGSYGRCWHPASVAVGWRPYCYGSWVWTDCGWYWASDEPWAWACYHYGWWYYDPVYAWIWVPGIEWGPAWVSWRFGGGYCGWAPLAPRGVVVAPGLFVFVEASRFHERITPQTVVVNNTTVINKTTVVNSSIRQETRTIAGSPQRVAFNEGPGLAPIQNATGRKISAVSITEAVRQTPVPGSVTSKTTTEPTQQGKPPVTPEQSRPTPQHPPAEVTPPPPKQDPPDRGHPPSKDDVAPAPSQPPPPHKQGPPDRRHPPSKGEAAPVPSQPSLPPPPTAPDRPPGPPKEKGQEKDEL